MKHFVSSLRKKAADINIGLAVLILEATIQRLDRGARRRDSPRNGWLALHEKLNALRALGLTAPADLVRLEHELEDEFAQKNRKRCI